MNDIRHHTPHTEIQHKDKQFSELRYTFFRKSMKNASTMPLSKPPKTGTHLPKFTSPTGCHILCTTSYLTRVKKSINHIQKRNLFHTFESRKLITNLPLRTSKRKYIKIDMKKLLCTIGAFCFAVANFAQTYPVDLTVKMEKGYNGLNKGTQVHIKGVEYAPSEYNNAVNGNSYFLLVDDQKIEVTDKIENKMSFEYRRVQDLWDAEIISNVLFLLQKKGPQNDMRSDMESDALEYINKVKSYNMELNDPCLENYIYGLIAKIAPVDIIDGRPGNVNLLILDDPSMNACIYPNGTLVLHTGLLSCLHSEDELVAVLSHEIAHFILDHSVQNVNKTITRQKRAEFWTALATGVTAVAEGVAASKNNYYVPGAATLGVAVLSSAIASQVIDRLGMQYNHEQEYEADGLAIKVLELLGYDKNALATALNRIQLAMVSERSKAMYFQSYSHPALMERINKAGKPLEERNQSFEKEISFAVSSTARLKFEDRRFRQALALVSQNINNKVATSEDYIIKAHCLMALYNDDANNNLAWSMIHQAKAINPENINIYKIEILTSIRLKNKAEALTLLQEYEAKLMQMRESLTRTESDLTWDETNRYTLKELEWAKKMQVKLQNM